jgi:hypothetical protein
VRGLDGLALGIGKERMSVHATRIAAGSASATQARPLGCPFDRCFVACFHSLPEFKPPRHSTYARLSSGGSMGLQTLSVYFSGFRLPWPFYRLIKHGQQYVDKGTEYYEARYREQPIRSLMKLAQKLGFQLVIPKTA